MTTKKIKFYIKLVKKNSKTDKEIAKLTLGFINRYRKDLEALAQK